MIEDVALVAKIEEVKVKIAFSTVDPITHTAENGFQCWCSDCPCYLKAQERREKLLINGNDAFSLLR